MKNTFLVVLILSTLLVSCYNDDDYNYDYSCYSTLAIPIDSVFTESNTINLGETLQVFTYSFYARQCEGFYGYDYQVAGNQRNVVTYAAVNDCVDCGEFEERENYFNFRPENANTYLFKFWAGVDDDGNDIFIEKEIIVE